MDRAFSRKDFFKSFHKQVLDNLHGEEEAETGIAEEVKVVFRPPGAIADDTIFLKKCVTGCRKCGEACPHGAVIFPKNGRKKKIPPEMDFAGKPCRWCAGFPCIAACPSGALEMNTAPAPLGRAVIDMERCSTSAGMLCEICYTVCPSTVRAIRMDAQRQPVVNPDKCTGCGTCAYYCDIIPSAISIVK